MYYIECRAGKINKKINSDVSFVCEIKDGTIYFIDDLSRAVFFRDRECANFVIFNCPDSYALSIVEADDEKVGLYKPGHRDLSFLLCQ